METRERKKGFFLDNDVFTATLLVFSVAPMPRGRNLPGTAVKTVLTQLEQKFYFHSSLQIESKLVQFKQEHTTTKKLFLNLDPPE